MSLSGIRAVLFYALQGLTLCFGVCVPIEKLKERWKAEAGKHDAGAKATASVRRSRVFSIETGYSQRRLKSSAET
jgi:hypothetical protein